MAWRRVTMAKRRNRSRGKSRKSSRNPAPVIAGEQEIPWWHKLINWPLIAAYAVAFLYLAFLPSLGDAMLILFLFGLFVVWFGHIACDEEESTVSEVFKWTVNLAYLLFVVALPYVSTLHILFLISVLAFLALARGLRYIILPVGVFFVLLLLFYSGIKAWRIIELNTMRGDSIRQINFKNKSRLTVVDNPDELRRIAGGFHLYRRATSAARDYWERGYMKYIANDPEPWECEIIFKNGERIDLVIVHGSYDACSERVYILDQKIYDMPDILKHGQSGTIYQSPRLYEALKPLLWPQPVSSEKL